MKLVEVIKGHRKLLLILIPILVIGLALGYLYYQLTQTLDSLYQPVERIKTEIPKLVYKPELVNDRMTLKTSMPDTTTFLLLGVDQRPGDIGRTDTIIFVVLNRTTNSITMLSIPRDSYVEIYGKNYEDKINHSYQYGVATTIATVENLLHIPIDHYVLINMSGFERAIDALGGVKINVDHNAAVGYKGILPGEGEHVLTGNQTLYFARFRKDSQGDFGRNERQRAVLKALFDQHGDLTSIPKMNDLLTILGEDVKMDLNKEELYRIAKSMKDYSSNHIETVTYRVSSARFGPQNLWYALISEQERERITNLLNDKLTATK